MDYNKIILELNERAKAMKPLPIYFYPYLTRVLNTHFNEIKPEFPMVIKLPQESSRLLKGDLEPKEVLTIEKPLLLHDGVTPVWFGNSSEQVYARFGYRNMDARYISTERFDMEFIHAFLGGSTGHGKSVTMNAMLGCMFYEYPPWELEVHLSDAKIIEFKKYGVNHRIPHIRSIAATEDADFVISVLDNAIEEMNIRNKLFGNYGCSNLRSFRKKTGLALPRIIIVMDEVESTFSLAGKKAPKIANAIDAVTRLGRAAGIHIVMATQNLSSAIPSSAIGQIRTRMCLGASESVSEKILGNNGAAENFSKLGKLIVNTSVLNGGNTRLGNVQYQSPFITDDNFEFEMKELEDLGKSIGFKPSMAFYDEAKLHTIDSFKNSISKSKDAMKANGVLNPANTILFLGEPAFVSTEPDNILKIRMDYKDIENLIICSTDKNRMIAHVNNIYNSMDGQCQIIHLSSEEEFLSLTPGAILAEQVKASTAAAMSSFTDVINRRLFLLEVDKIAFRGSVTYDNAAVEKLMKECGVPEEYLGNSLLKKRFMCYNHIQKLPEFTPLWESVSNSLNTFLPVFNDYFKYNAVNEKLTKDKFPRFCVMLGLLSSIVGYGRDNKSRELTKLKKLLQDCCGAGAFFVLYTRSMEDLNDLNSGIRYAIMDKENYTDWSKLKIEQLSEATSVTATLADKLNSQYKFKTTLLHD